jgi:hypothetical protein
LTARTSPGTSWRSHGIAQQDIDTVWTAIALHKTPGIPEHVQPMVALVMTGVEMDVLGLAYSEYSDAESKTVVHAHPRSAHFKAFAFGDDVLGQDLLQGLHSRIPDHEPQEFAYSEPSIPSRFQGNWEKRSR